MISFKRALLVMFLTAAFTLEAKAVSFGVPTLRLGLGKYSTSFTAGGDFPDTNPLEATATINPMFLWEAPGLRTRFGFHFTSDFDSPFGFMPITGVGFTFLFYPMGLSTSYELREDLTEIVKSRLSPYLQVSITPTKFSATRIPNANDPVFDRPDQWDYVSALVIETNIGAGVDYPLSDSLTIFGGLHYRMAAFGSQDSNAGQVSYKGLGLLLGVMSSFF